MLDTNKLCAELSMTLEAWQVVASFLTPLIVLVFGFLINRTLEKSKVAYLQEKEWQVRWAETFLIRAIKFEENISVVVTSLSQLQQNAQNRSKSGSSEDELLKTINQSIANIQYLDWDIQNFAQFADDGEGVIHRGKQLMDAIRNIFDKKQGDLESIRQMQFEYNKAVRTAHSQILKAKS
ncbi:MAG: hypothetical protein L3J88_08740 [Gammaproteobacteria bacterium]|nr:hypothetical protein [Gammaproteobacteria bacterium]MCF6363415.1 hypothetical protein [Gammaproteobacteria bacterium]